MPLPRSGIPVRPRTKGQTKYDRLTGDDIEIPRP